MRTSYKPPKEPIIDLDKYSYYQYCINMRLVSTRTFDNEDVLSKVKATLKSHGTPTPGDMQLCSVRLQSKEVWLDNDLVDMKVQDQDGSTWDNVILEVLAGISCIKAVKYETTGTLHFVGGTADISDLGNENLLAFNFPNIDFKTKERKSDGDFVRTNAKGRILRFLKDKDLVESPPVFVQHVVAAKVPNRSMLLTSVC
jgi:hypothetical protein